MKKDILQFLYDNRYNYDVDLSVFLRSNYPKISQEIVRNVLLELIERGYTTGFSYDHAINAAQKLSTFENFKFPVILKITTAGEDYLEHQLLNDSIRKINNTVIPNFNRTQKNLTIVTLVIAGLSFIAIAVSAYYSSKGITSEELQETNKHLQNSTRILDSMLQVQKGIDSSLETTAKDSVKKIYVLKKKT